MKKHLTLLCLAAFGLANANQVASPEEISPEQQLGLLVEQRKLMANIQGLVREFNADAQYSNQQLEEYYKKLADDYTVLKNSYEKTRANYCKGKAKYSDLCAIEQQLRMIEEQMASLQLFSQLRGQAEQSQPNAPSQPQPAQKRDKRGR